MSDAHPEPEHLIAYLLGELGEGEASALEQQFMVDDSLLELLDATEAELFDDYAAQQLSESRRAAFQERFLTGCDADRRLRFAAALNQRLTAQPARAPIRVPWFRRIFHPVPMGAVAVALAAIVMIVVVRPGEPGPPAEASLELDSLTVRGESGVSVLPTAERVVVSLDVPQAGTYTARLLRGDAETAVLDVASDGESIRVVIDTRGLSTGIYELELSRATDGGQGRVIGFYSLEKR